MKVSVCMATYNGARFIKEQISSILNQKYDVENDVELELIICKYSVMRTLPTP